MVENENTGKAWYPHGDAIWDYFRDPEKDPRVLVQTLDGDVTAFPAAVYFREEDDLMWMDECILEECKGRILDIGAGAGAITLLLQEAGFDVTAIDVAEKAVITMRERGVIDARTADFYTFSGESYDTLICLMNGIGFVDTLDGFSRFLTHARTLLNPGGKVLFDSSDIHLAEDASDLIKLSDDNYPGRIWYQISYEGRTGTPYHWLYLDPETAAGLAAAEGWAFEILEYGPEGSYVAQLVPE